MIFPKPLQKGDTVAVVCPAGFIAENETLDTAVFLLKSWGLNVVFGKHLHAKHHHFAGTDVQRSTDFQDALDNENIQAIWCCRGGYGSIRIVDMLDFSAFLKNPKWIIGYSDITIFLNHLAALGVGSIHGLMPTSKASFKSKKAVDTLYDALFGKKLKYTLPSSKYNKTGSGKGTLIGGNLAVFTSLLGSKSLVQPTSKNILFIEDIGEYKYKIDRMLYSLKRAGYFEHCNGLIVGGFTNTPVNAPLFGKTIEEIVLEITADFKFPVCFDFKAGHVQENCALIIGSTVELTVKKQESTLHFYGTA